MNRQGFPELPKPPPPTTETTERRLLEQLEDFKLQVAGRGRVKGLTAERKKQGTEVLLHELRIDRKGTRQLTWEQSLQWRKYLRFVLQKAGEVLAERRGGR